MVSRFARWFPSFIGTGGLAYVTAEKNKKHGKFSHNVPYMDHLESVVLTPIKNLPTYRIFQAGSHGRNIGIPIKAWFHGMILFERFSFNQMYSQVPRRRMAKIFGRRTSRGILSLFNVWQIGWVLGVKVEGIHHLELELRCWSMVVILQHLRIEGIETKQIIQYWIYSNIFVEKTVETYGQSKRMSSRSLSMITST